MATEIFLQLPGASVNAFGEGDNKQQLDWPPFQSPWGIGKAGVVISSSFFCDGFMFWPVADAKRNRIIIAERLNHRVQCLSLGKVVWTYGIDKNRTFVFVLLFFLLVKNFCSREWTWPVRFSCWFSYRLFHGLDLYL